MRYTPRLWYCYSVGTEYICTATGLLVIRNAYGRLALPPSSLFVCTRFLESCPLLPYLPTHLGDAGQGYGSTRVWGVGAKAVFGALCVSGVCACLAAPRSLMKRVCVLPAIITRYSVWVV